MHIVVPGIGRGPIDHGLYTFHCHHLTRLAGQRQGKVAQTAEQVQHTLVGLWREPGQSLLDHRRIDLGIHLHEIARAPGQLQLPRCQGKAQLRRWVHGRRLTFALQPQLGVGLLAERLQPGLVLSRQRRDVAHQNRLGGATEQLYMAQRLRLAQRTQHRRQVAQNGLQGLYQHCTIVDGNDVLAGFGAETHFQLTRLTSQRTATRARRR